MTIKMEKVNIKDLIKQCSTEDCTVKYYTDFDFLDVYEEPNKIRKKSISSENIPKDRYSIGYFRDGKLIRITAKDKITTETYILYEKGLVCAAYTFQFKEPLHLFKKPDLIASYTYTYDENDRMLQSQWKHISGYDRHISSVVSDHEYDDRGLRYIHKTVSNTAAKEPEKFIMYDREHEKYIKQFTVTKSSLIEHKARTNDGTVDFENKSGYNTKLCPHCNGSLTHILTLDLQNRKNLNKTSACAKIPVMFCFDCLKDQRYTESELTLPSSAKPFIDNASYKFSASTDEECLEKAFIKIGGVPEWIQNEDQPICPVCKKPMVYMMTIDSREEYSNGKDCLMFGDCGKLYVFNCCGHTAVIMQCY